MPNSLYNRFNPDEDYSGIDHVIVGSGLGGLTAAAWLAKSGKKVLVLEQHYVPGGFTHSFKRKNGFKWDVGVHYVGNMAEGSAMHKLFDYITGKKLKWASMGEVYDVVCIGDDRYEFKAGKEAFRNQMVVYFPDEEKAIDQYLHLVEKSNKRANLFFADKAFKPLLTHTLGKIFRQRFYHFSDRTTYDVLSELTTNKRLIAVLCGQYGNYGLPPKRSSFAAHALVSGHFLDGGYYPVGGAENIAKFAMETIKHHGGKVLVRAKVDEIVVEKNRVTGVQIGSVFIKCKSVLSNVGAYNTFGHLLQKVKNAVPNSFDKVKQHPSIGHLCLYLGLDASAEKLGLPKYNTWCYAGSLQTENLENATAENAPDGITYISFPSAKDPAWAEQNPETATIQAISAGQFAWFAKYQNQPWRNREEEYKKMKQQFKEQMLQKLYELYPQIKGHVLVSEVSTPLSTRHFANYQHGEIYGLAHTPSRFRQHFLRPDTRIKGLKLVGQDITIVGVAGAMLSGILGAISILKWRVWRNFKEMGAQD